jgi:hypothetical protein
MITNLGPKKTGVGRLVKMVTYRIREGGDERRMLIYGYIFQCTHTPGSPGVVKGVFSDQCYPLFARSSIKNVLLHCNGVKYFS